MKNVLLMLIVFTVLVTNRGFAQQDTTFLDLETSIDYAIRNNKTLKIEQLEILKKEYQLKSAKGGLMPSVKATGTYMRNIDLPVIFMPEGSPFGTTLQIGYDNSFQGGAQASLVLFSSQLLSAIELSKKNLALELEKQKESELDMRYQVTKTYYGALFAKEAARVIEISYNNAVESYENISNLYQQGMASEYDKIRAKVTAENLKPSVAELNNAYEIALSMLRFLTGLEPGTVIGLKGNLDLSDISTSNLNAETGIDNNPSLRQLKLQIGMIQNQVDMTRKSMYPNLAGFWNYQYQAQANDFKIGDYNWVRTQALGLSLNIPVFSGLTNKNKINELNVAVDQLNLQKDYLTDNLSVQLNNSFKTMMVAAEKIDNTKENIDLAQRGYQIAKTAYNSGTVTLLDLNASELALTQARLNYYQAIYEYELAKLEYLKLLGIN